MLRNKINLSVNNNIYNIEQSRYSEIKQPVSSRSNTITDTKLTPVKQPDPEHETILTDHKPTDSANNESWL